MDAKRRKEVKNGGDRPGGGGVPTSWGTARFAADIAAKRQVLSWQNKETKKEVDTEEEDEVTLIRFIKKKKKKKKRAPGPCRQTGRLILTTSVNSLLPRSSLSSCVSFCMLLQTHARSGDVKKASRSLYAASRAERVKQTNTIKCNLMFQKRVFSFLLRLTRFSQNSLMWNETSSGGGGGGGGAELGFEDWKM